MLVVKPSLRADGKQRSGAVLVTIEEEGEEEEEEEEEGGEVEGFKQLGGSEERLKLTLRQPVHESGNFGGKVYDWLTGRISRETAEAGAQLRGREVEKIAGKTQDGEEESAERGIDDDGEPGRKVGAIAANATAAAQGTTQQRAGEGAGRSAGKATGSAALAAAAGDVSRGTPTKSSAVQSGLAGQKTIKEGRRGKGDARERVLATAGGVMREVEGQFMVAPWHPVKLAKIKKAAAPDTAGAKW